jgi:hypothetical protein
MSIDEIELNKFVGNQHIDHLINPSENKDIQRRAYFFVNNLHHLIHTERLRILLDVKERPDPYNNTNLQGLDIDKHKLALINQFDLNNFGLQRGDLVYTLCPILEQLNSSYWIFQSILKLARQEKINFKLRLDPFIEIPVNDYHPIFYKMFVHGRPLNWEKLLSLRNDDYGQWFDEKEYNRIGFTDYVWSPKKDELHFTCEELPKIDSIGLKNSRYFHAIINKKTGGIKHCDGAIRLFSDDDLKIRLKFHIKDSIVTKSGRRIKIFQYESHENSGIEINQDNFSKIAVSFFVWNNDVQNYFN